MNALSYSHASQNPLIKYKLYHILFWCVYHYLFWMIRIGSPIETFVAIFSYPYFIKFIFYVVFQAIAAYFNLYFLIPRFLEKSRFAEYILYLALTIVCSASMIVTGYYLLAFAIGKSVQEQFGVPTDSFFHLFATFTLPSTIASTTLAMSIKLTKNWVQTKRRQQLLEKEKLETELKFLKYQFNPHFLFNTINSIFFLIHKNPDKASASLAKFSELLRHQLYECNDSQISLGKEIAYLENFIELEKLRQNSSLEVSFEMNEPFTEHLGIAPFILMTFVENAFKHVSKHKSKPNWIRMKLTMEHEWMEFAVTNSTSHSGSTDVVKYGGIGLQNVQRRLDLLYAGKHDLTIQSNEQSFQVKLRLQLSGLAVPQPMPVLV